MELMNYSVIQRDDDGYGRFEYSGKCPDAYDGERIYVRVVREEDNLIIVENADCTVNENGWHVSLEIPEGGLYRVETIYCCKGSRGTRIECRFHVGVGDVYVTAGQSNMSGYGLDTAYDPPQLGVHAYYNRGTWDIAAHPLGCSAGSIYRPCDGLSETSPALSFGRFLSNRLHLPIGLVPAAVGSSLLETWKPDEDGTNWNQVLERLKIVGKVKGIIWSQGCADASARKGTDYYERLASAIAQWREVLGPVPVLMLQLNRTVNADPELSRHWGMVIDAQRKASLTIPGVYCVPSYDMTTFDTIHNASGSNVILGERLANAALVGVYGQRGRTAIAFTSCEAIDNTHVKLNITQNFTTRLWDNTADGMNVEDEDGLIDCIGCCHYGTYLVVTTPRPYKLPAKFHFSWKTHPPMFVGHESNGQPFLSCYGLPIEKT